MKKSQLKTGHIVETRAGEKALIVLNNVYGEDAVIFADNNWTDLNGFNDDLFWHPESNTEYSKTVDIMKVYQPILPCYFLSKSNFTMDLIWEREEEQIIELTIDQIAELKGVKPSQIKIKK